MSVSARPKRFYTRAEAIPADGEGWTVALDGRPLRTPGRATLALPSKALAAAISAEWAGQGEHLDIQAMHLTRLANVAIDRTPATRGALAEDIVRYCETDLLCHLADGPADLRARQEAAWAEIRYWAGRALDVFLLPVEGIIAAPQPAASLDAAYNHAMSLDAFRLTGLAFGCGLFGSALLALAVEQGRLDVQDAFARARIDEDYQAEQWGRDKEADAAAAAKRAEAQALGAWFAALGQG